jgi:hypothetical protein
VSSVCGQGIWSPDIGRPGLVQRRRRGGAKMEAKVKLITGRAHILSSHHIGRRGVAPRDSSGPARGWDQPQIGSNKAKCLGCRQRGG